jgi:hypothetical protein
VVELRWNGADKKDDLSIVTSDFDMLSTDARDAAFDFFTGDEHRFKVLVKTLMMIVSFWQGIFYRTYTVSLISK